MKKDRSKPLMLYVAEKIYNSVSKIKKDNPGITLIEAIEMFSTSKEYIEIKCGNFHNQLFDDIKENNYINKETKIKIPEETINLLKVQRDSVMEKLNFSNNTYFAKSSFPLSNTQNSFDLLWRMCESYELWCKEVDKKDLIKLNITAENKFLKIQKSIYKNCSNNIKKYPEKSLDFYFIHSMYCIGSYSSHYGCNWNKN